MLKEHELVIVSFFIINHKFVYCISFHVQSECLFICLLKSPNQIMNIIPSWLTQSSGFKPFAGLVRFMCLLVSNFNPSYLHVCLPLLLNSGIDCREE